MVPSLSSLHSPAWVDLLAELKEEFNPNTCWHHSGLNTAPSFCQSAQPCLPQLRVLLFLSQCLKAREMGWVWGTGDGELAAGWDGFGEQGMESWQRDGVDLGNRDLRALCEITTTHGRCLGGTAGHICRAVQQSDPLSSTMGKPHLGITGHVYKHGQTAPDSSIFPVTVRDPFSPACP